MTKERKTFVSRIDSVTIMLYLILVFIGLVTVFSVEYRSTDPSIFIMSKSHMKQFTWLCVSLFVGLIILFTESKFFSSFAFLFYTIGIVLLVVTIFAGKNVKGSHSWLGVGSFAFQPGEVCKIFTALALSKFLSIPETNFKTLKDRLIGASLALVPCFIIIMHLKPYKVKHTALGNIPDTVYSIVKHAMQDVVEHGTGRVAQLPGIEICAKTGTVENKAVVHGKAMQMKDHSVFVAFAPRVNPKIAIAVIVENAGYGATWAGPVASLMIEKYLTDSVATRRKHLEERLYNAKLINPYIYAIDSADKRKWREREARRIEAKRIKDSTTRARDSIMIRAWFEKRLGRKLPEKLILSK